MLRSHGTATLPYDWPHPRSAMDQVRYAGTAREKTAGVVGAKPDCIVFL
jgi:hypothetical protein